MLGTQTMAAVHDDGTLLVDVTLQCFRPDDDAGSSRTARYRFMGGTLVHRGVASGDASPAAETPAAQVICFEEAPLFDRQTTCVVGPECVIAVPPGLSLASACAALPGALRAVAALYFRAPPEACRGGAVVIIDCEAPASLLAAQLAARWGAALLIVHCRDGSDEAVAAARALYESVLSLGVFAAATSAYAAAAAGASTAAPHPHPRPCLLVIGGPGEALLDATLRATGGVGVDVVLQLEEEDEGAAPPSLLQLAQCIRVHGHVCSARRFRQGSPPLDASAASAFALLQRKGGSLHALCDDAWLGVPRGRGRLLHVLAEVLGLLGRGELTGPRPRLCHLGSPSDSPRATGKETVAELSQTAQALGRPAYRLPHVDLWTLL